jgi:hypothetical protein
MGRRDFKRTIRITQEACRVAFGKGCINTMVKPTRFSWGGAWLAEREAKIGVIETWLSTHFVGIPDKL